MNFLFNLSNSIKNIITLVVDFVLLNIALILALSLRLGDWSGLAQSEQLLAMFISLLTVLVASVLGMYQAVIRFIGTKTIVLAMISVTVSSAMLAVSILFFDFSLPRSVPGIFWAIACILLLSVRFGFRAIFRHFYSNRFCESVIIYGAGTSGRQLASSLTHGDRYSPVAFIDDNKKLWGQDMQGIRVYPPTAVQEIVEDYDVKRVLLAMAKNVGNSRKKIISRLEHLAVKVQTIPSSSELISGEVSIEEIRDIDLNDLLGRQSVSANSKLLQACIEGKSVLVTGAGGSIGSELCRQIAKHCPKTIVLLELNEFSLYRIEKELLKLSHKQGYDFNIIPLLGNVNDKDKCHRLLKLYNVNTIYHAAAYKHVPIVEHNLIEGVFNNVFGTYALATAAVDNQVETFILISTDKAVRPTNAMGASKRLAELILQGLAKQDHNTTFGMVRFGNVLGSSGSVVPLFKEQIKAGGPITVTHPEITRYFMTIPEAAELVIQAGSMAVGGDVFVLDMGDPVKIYELAVRMIHVMGLESYTENSGKGDIEIKFTGLRPGEKLYEELLVGDNVSGTVHPRIMTAQELDMEWSALEKLLKNFKIHAQNWDCAAILELLRQAPLQYQPNDEEVHDLLWDKKKMTQQDNVVQMGQ